MKISDIKQNGDIFTVTFTPSTLMGKYIFKVKEKIVRYKKLDATYKNYSWLTAFRHENGQIVNAIDDNYIVEELNKFINKF